jgi:hypothetical protein
MAKTGLKTGHFNSLTHLFQFNNNSPIRCSITNARVVNRRHECAKRHASLYGHVAFTGVPVCFQTLLYDEVHVYIWRRTDCTWLSLLLKDAASELFVNTNHKRWEVTDCLNRFPKNVSKYFVLSPCNNFYNMIICNYNIIINTDHTRLQYTLLFKIAKGTRKNFCGNYRQFGDALWKIFCRPDLCGSKRLEKQMKATLNRLCIGWCI